MKRVRRERDIPLLVAMKRVRREKDVRQIHVEFVFTMGLARDYVKFREYKNIVLGTNHILLKQILKIKNVEEFENVRTKRFFYFEKRDII